MAKTILGGKCRAIIIYIWKKNPIPKVRKRTEEQTQRKQRKGNIKDRINEIENKEPIEKIQ